MTRFNLILIFILIVGSILAIAKISDLNSDLKDTYRNVQLKEQEIERYKQDSTWRAKIEAVVADQKTIMELYGRELSSIRGDIKGVKKDLSNLDNVKVVSTVHVDSIFVPIKGSIPDSTYTIKKRWSNHWITFNNNNLSLRYRIKDSLRITGYWEGGFLKKPVLKTEVKSFNPSTSIENFMDINIAPPKPKRFYIGPYVGYDLFNGFSLGVGIGYGLIRL